MSIDLLLTWLLIFLRAVGIVLLMPQMAGKAAPIFIRLAIAGCLATLLAGVVPPAAIPTDLFGFIEATVGELLLGLAFGFVAQMAFSAVEMAGRVASPEVGLSAAHGMGAPQLGSEPLAAFLSVFAVVLFFAFGGHLAVLGAFAKSFAIAPPGRPLFSAFAPELMIVATGRVIELGLRMAAPFIALNFLITLAFSVLGRAVPRMNVFILSATVRGMAGLILFSGAGALIARYLYTEFAEIPRNVLEILPAH